ncbi:hypothetical protein BGZ80_007608, partial [Entomortierella chlamydospora]
LQSPAIKLTKIRLGHGEHLLRLLEIYQSTCFSVIRIQGYLRKFYGSYIFKMKSRCIEQAEMATLNKGISKPFRTGGCKNNGQRQGMTTAYSLP